MNMHNIFSWPKWQQQNIKMSYPQIAAHEAGHVVTAHYFGFVVSECCIDDKHPSVPDHGMGGTAIVFPEPAHSLRNGDQDVFIKSEDQWRDCENSIMCLLAGGAAVSMRYPDYTQQEYESKFDLEQVDQIFQGMQRFDAKRAKQGRESYRNQVDELLDKLKDQLVAVADALYDEGYLDENQIVKLMA